MFVPGSFHSVGHNEVIGVCRVGNDGESLGRDHWNEMLTYPRKPIARWHPLIEVSVFSGPGEPEQSVYDFESPGESIQS